MFNLKSISPGRRVWGIIVLLFSVNLLPCTCHDLFESGYRLMEASTRAALPPEVVLHIRIDRYRFDSESRQSDLRAKTWLERVRLVAADSSASHEPNDFAIAIQEYRTREDLWLLIRPLKKLPPGKYEVLMLMPPVPPERVSTFDSLGSFVTGGDTPELLGKWPVPVKPAFIWNPCPGCCDCENGRPVIALIFADASNRPESELVFVWEADAQNKIDYDSAPALITEMWRGVIGLGNSTSCGYQYDFFIAKGRSSRIGLRRSDGNGRLSQPIELNIDLSDWQDARNVKQPRSPWYCVPHSIIFNDEPSYRQIEQLRRQSH